MNTIREVVEKHQQQVMDSFCPSIYTKEEVFHLLGEVLLVDLEKLESQTKKIEFDLEEFKEDVIDKVERIIDNFDIEDNVELEMSGREIQVSFDTSNLKDEIRDSISELIDLTELHKLVTSDEYMN
jgi:predicted RNA-binding protein Jag